MKVIRFRLLIAFMAVLMGSVIAKSQTADDAPPPPPMHGHGMGMGMPGHLPFLAAKLNLTDDQKTQMKSVMQKERPTIEPLHQQEHQIDQQLRQYVEGTFDQAKVAALAAQKAQVQAAITVEETRIHNQLYQLLRDDQKTQLKQMEASHEARMQERMNKQAPAPPEE
ncbi:MAG TPA: Spy/CpxP family protein refolding chaperone [Candidatus Binatia bacterium]|nr:Spy/CpxP family protein refolding chaperone [Candidatus Binatia bacterium]